MKGARIDGMGFADFSALREKLRASGGLLDMAESNLYAALPRSFPGRFEPVGQSQDPKAAYRCHVAEAFLERWGFAEGFKARASVTRGVRQSLAGLFAMLAQAGARALLPSDVYPVYVDLARAAGLDCVFYRARLGPPTAELLAGASAVLVCDPLKPWGGAMGAQGEARLAAWARADPSGRLLMIDSAYAVDWSPASRRLVEGGAAMGLASLSKGWLAPWRAGCAIAPSPWAARARVALAGFPKDEAALRVGFEALGKRAHMPGEVEQALRELSEQALGRLGRECADLEGSGYLRVSSSSADEWLARGVLAIPGSVFGDGGSGSVLSMLDPI